MDTALIIGLDGATWRTLTPAIAAGQLPNLARLVKTGVSGDLQSTTPPVTAPAWTTFATGKKPGKHGIYWFGTYNAEAATFVPNNAARVQAETLWQTLGRYGKTVAVINMPMTYPPLPVNGYMITGMLTPNTNVEFTYPGALAPELRASKYPIDVPWAEYLDDDPGLLLDDLEAMTEARCRTTLALYKRNPTDALFLTLVGLDRIYHCLWGYAVADNTHLPDYDRIHTRILNFLTQIDHWIGHLVDEIAGHGPVVLVSDHGFGPFHSEFYMNRWLRDEGYLVVKSHRPRSLRSVRQFARRMGLSGQNIRSLLGYGTTRRLKRLTELIDWSSTRAVLAYNGVRINLRGREHDGIVEPGAEYEALRAEIKARALQIRDPSTGKLIVVAAHNIEDISQGPCVDRAHADLVFTFNDDGYVAQKADPTVPGPFMPPAGWSPGCHRLEGIFVLNGPGIRKGRVLHGTHIADLAPTLLHLLGLPISTDVDGRILTEALTPVFAAAYPTRYEETDAHHTADTALSDQEQQNIKARLQGLGYID